MRKAILAGINLNKSDEDFKVVLEETSELCIACEIEVIDYCIQKSRSLDPRTAFRKGKLEELAEMVIEKEVDCVVFYNNLSASMLSRIQEECNIAIIDRTNLILDIFSLRAKSKEAKLQTHMARLKYDLPKLYLMEVDSDRERGGREHNKGAGETKLELRKRDIESQISEIKKQLEALATSNEERSKRRSDTFIKSVALVGYTNAGKSSLMNLILKYNNKDEDKFVLQKDMLFATLDTSIRSVSYDGQGFLLFDTVGFVSDLPHELIEAFKSTLDAVKDADLLIHVIDSSDPHYNNQRQITYDTLKKIHADNIPYIEVYNKVDKIKERDSNLRYLSCVSEEGLNSLMQTIIDTLYPKEFSLKVLLPYNKQGMLDKYKNHLKISSFENNEEGSIIFLNGDKIMHDAFLPFKED